MALLLERLRAHLDRARLFPAPGSAVLAVSGGPDSVALLDLMLAVARERGLSLVVAHADHGIRADSRTVGQSVGELARRSGLPFELGELELGPGATETAARRARYAWLALVQRRHAARYLVTAHHADDQVETILLRVLKGSGPAGLAGMPARGRGGIVRPLLPFSRAELAVHVAERGLAFHDDPANRDPRHLRSWLRVTLLPQLVTRLGTNLRADVLRLGGRPRSSDARGIVRWNSFRSFGFSAPPAGSTLLGPLCPAMIRHCRPRFCGRLPGAWGWCSAPAACGVCWLSQAGRRGAACRSVPVG